MVWVYLEDSVKFGSYSYISIGYLVLKMSFKVVWNMV